MRGKKENIMANKKKGNLELLNDNNSVLVLIDYQPTMFAGVAFGDKTIIRNAAYSATKAAQILNIPVDYRQLIHKAMAIFLMR